MREGRPRQEPTTEEHHPPAPGDTRRGRPALLVAFPDVKLLPIPDSGAIVGRSWLALAGRTDGEISSRHMRFSRAGGKCHVEDVGSRNGTWLNGHRLVPGERVALDDGAVLRVGLTLMVFREDFTEGDAPELPLGDLIGPWGLGEVRAAITSLAARPERNVLITGETGTGKELVASAVVQAIGRAGKPFERINVTGVAEGVFESQFFGWVKGAFSGSGEGSRGVLRRNEHGTVFLDEIGELSLKLQPKLLRMLENREVLPVGAERTVSVDVALLAATNRDLEEMVEEGTFRRDLLARFIARIDLPALRDRPEDVFSILRALRERRGAPLTPAHVEVEAIERLMLHGWSANVRELERVAASFDPAAPLTLFAVERVLGQNERSSSPPLTIEAVKRALEECGGNKSKAARKLGVDRARLLRALKKSTGGG